MTETKNEIAFLFPGQGSQAVGMGKDLAEQYPVARKTFEEADELWDTSSRNSASKARRSNCG